MKQRKQIKQKRKKRWTPQLFKSWIVLSIHRINHYPADKYLGELPYPLNRDLFIE